MAINAFSNVLLTSLIGGRIWWIMREVDKIGSKHRSGALMSKKHYLTTIALVLESGLLYPLIVIIFEIVTNTAAVSPSLYPLMTLVAGIAPTLIFVRVRLGVSINSVDETVSTLSTGASDSRMRVTMTRITATDSESELKV
ncbi:hypothetical protein VKT23_012125 [Stygiomarasmius scandens]|uniref:G protein-coupled receptor n=1 Tax=Marasmiellus scandens TaxID=2682957 RepID=A0ABR1J7Q8_9AGAR